tara:strand:+ start:89 stop:703 length:615 start_codon:yes stop_codon:yes gene_type:complete
MGRYKGPLCKICRRNGVKLYLKGDRCHTAKCAIEKRNFPPGPRFGMMRKLSEYGRRLREKQKLRFFYGVNELKMQQLYRKASKKKGITGNNLLISLETRLDNLIYRAGLADSRREARQLVKHNHFLLNGKKVNVPSLLAEKDDEIVIKNDTLIEKSKKNIEKIEWPEWLSYDAKKKVIKILQLPKREDIDVPVEEQLIVEYYSQ